jgi:hypothetical protein
MESGWALWAHPAVRENLRIRWTLPRGNQNNRLIHRILRFSLTAGWAQRAHPLSIHQTQISLRLAHHWLERALDWIRDKLNLKVVSMAQPKYSQIVRHLDRGGIIILMYHWDTRLTQIPVTLDTYGDKVCDHFTLVVGRHQNSFTLVNNTPTAGPVETVSRRTFLGMLRPFEYDPPLQPDPRDNIYPWAWLISP